LTFEQADTDTFRNLALAYSAMNKGGNAPCILNAANEVAVEAFLNDQVGFLEMSDVLETCLAKVEFIKKPNYSDLVETDSATRGLAKELIS
jgi:1-deoxy-D-xylulose-5-phosphate reductoisomerase